MSGRCLYFILFHNQLIGNILWALNLRWFPRFILAELSPVYRRWTKVNLMFHTWLLISRACYLRLTICKPLSTVATTHCHGQCRHMNAFYYCRCNVYCFSFSSWHLLSLINKEQDCSNVYAMHFMPPFLNGLIHHGSWWTIISIYMTFPPGGEVGLIFNNVRYVTMNHRFFLP